jgi:CheY-like chemotaxis protein
MKRILLADDSPQALRLAEQILGGQGIQVVSVTDGATAVRRLTDVDPDVLITDVFLPAKNGFELARFIKAQPEWKHIHIIFAAGMADEFDEQDAKNAGADVILRKPFEASALLGALHPLLEKAAALRPKGGASTPGLDRAMVRAAVTLALDSAMPSLIEDLTERVMIAVRQSLVVPPAPMKTPEPEPSPDTSAAATSATE